MNTSTIDNMSIDELARFVKESPMSHKLFIYAAKRLSERYFVNKSKELLELESELKDIYEKHPELIPYNPL